MPHHDSSRPVHGKAPSPIAVLCVFLRGGHTPPPIVIQCAIAEAQLLGRHDLARELTWKFVSPQSGAPIYAHMSGAPEMQHAEAPPDFAAFAQYQAPFESAPVAPQGEPLPQTVPPMSVPSPIPGVPDDAWSTFCGQLERESPSFQSQRHVGRYRHRKDRLAEIGMDPDSIVGSPDAQDQALAADLLDAHKHLTASGILRQHVGRPISIPDVDGTIPLTLSGVLGISAVAGLEGCAGWLENKADRKRFPHTTQTFLRTNGAF